MAYTAFNATSPTASMGGHVGQFIADSVGSAGFVAAPAAGATVTWIQAPQNGRYSVQLLWAYQPTLPTDPQSKTNNLRLQVDGTAVTSLTHLATASATYAATAILTVVTTNWISLNVISGDANGRYTGNLILSKLG